MSKKHISAFLLLSSLWLVACDPKNDDPLDITAPSIEIDHPDHGETFAAGGTIGLEIEIEDEVSVSSANVAVHSAADGHGHARTLATPFTFNKNYSLSGRDVEIRENISINADATAGPYHLVVSAIDEKGNATSFANGSTKEVEIWISNPEMAKIVILNNNGVPTDEIHVKADQPLTINGGITAGAGKIEAVTVKIVPEEDDDHSGHNHKVATTLYEKSFTLPVAVTELPFAALLAQEPIVITKAMIDALKGQDLDLIILAKDELGHIARYKAEIEF